MPFLNGQTDDIDDILSQLALEELKLVRKNGGQTFYPFYHKFIVNSTIQEHKC